MLLQRGILCESSLTKWATYILDENLKYLILAKCVGKQNNDLKNFSLRYFGVSPYLKVNKRELYIK